MADTTEISWTDATFNPWIGCTKVSPGCDNCYAATQDKFRKWTPEGWGGPRKRTSTANWQNPIQWNGQPFAQCGECGWRGELRHASTNDEPGQEGSWCPRCLMAHVKPARRRVFCASLADVFDNQVDPQWRVDLFALIAATPNLDWLLLTKRIGNVASMLGDYKTVPLLPNIWLGSTIVNREELLRDGPKLASIPARVKFWSAEPLLGDLGTIPAELMPNWVIVGGESGPGARPMHPDWARSLRDQCAAAGVPFHFKQHGEWYPWRDCPIPAKHSSEVYVEPDGTVVERTTRCDAALMLRIGKKAAGRMIDGVTHDAFPEVQ